MEHQIITGGTRVGSRAELRVIAATSARLPMGPRPSDREDSRRRSRYLLIAHPRKGLVLVDSGVGPSMIPTRGRGLTPIGLLSPWDLLAAIEVSPIHLTAAVVTGPEEDRLCNLARLPAGVPVFCDDRLRRKATSGGVVSRVSRNPAALLGRAEASLQSLHVLPRVSWLGVEGHDLFGDGSCLLIPLDDRPTGSLALLMPQVERIAHPLVYLTRPDLQITAENGRRALETMPPTIRRLMKLDCRVLHSADPAPTEIDVIEI